MSSYENAFMAVCQNCEKTFDINFTVINALNVDFSGYLNEKLLNNVINRITCPHCNCNFTFERPFLAYSVKNKFAIITDFSFCGNELHKGRTNLFKLFNCTDIRLRIVNYMCEASEKYRIFNCGLDDFKIEYLKFKLFDTGYFVDKTNKILLFDKVENNNIIFRLYSDIDEIIESYTIPFEEYNNIQGSFQLQYNYNDICVWYKIDTKYIKEYINE